MYVSVLYICVCVCAPPPLTCLSRSHPPACQHASTSHTLALGRSGSTRDVPAKSSSTSSLDPNTCNTKPWQPPTSHYQSYSIYRRYTTSLPLEHPPVHLSTLHCVSPRCSSDDHVFSVPLVAFNVQMSIKKMVWHSEWPLHKGWFRLRLIQSKDLNVFHLINAVSLNLEWAFTFFLIDKSAKLEYWCQYAANLLLKKQYIKCPCHY